MISLKIGYSPCPNDTFIMAALAENRLATPLMFEPVVADVETLNQWAVEERLEVTKLSFMALGQVRNSYGLLSAGGALGWGCGPLLVARPGRTVADLGHGVVAAPGAMTTAALLLSLFHGKQPNFRHMVFSDVMPAVASGEADFGLVIHEGRFTLGSYGLESLVDLGSWWEQETGRPIPLGGIAVRRDLGYELAQMVDQAIRGSVLDALGSPDQTMSYVQSHSQEMDRDVMAQHIKLYVNSFSVDLSEEGREAVALLFAKAEEAGLLPRSAMPLMAFPV
ncbi:MAG: 1,4-dihydroxy-6-naphthoate synthase [Desulfomonile tiedjei]|nr:1,4-dihydroxy-6-naphthoate synthase [Desulfomonile tiedjei]